MKNKPFLNEHDIPLPTKPSLHLHSYPLYRSIHCEFLSQLFNVLLEHSLIILCTKHDVPLPIKP